MQSEGEIKTGLSMDFIKKIPSLLSRPEYAKDLAEFKRTDLLPMLFRIKGEPFSLQNYPQFEVMYDKEMVPDLILLCGRQLGKCVSICRNTLRDEYGMKIAGIPSVGNHVLSFNGWKVVPGEICHVFTPGTKPVIRVKTAKGNDLYVTREHKVMTVSGFKEAGFLVPGDRIVSMRRGGIFGAEPIDDGRIRMTAYLLGNGSCSAKRHLAFATMCEEIVTDIKEINGDVDMRIERYKKSNKTFNVHFLVNAKANQWAELDGLIGSKSCDKKLPSWVYRINQDKTREFMGCLWATDGRIANDNHGFADISYCSTSKDLADGVRTLLFKLGYMNSCRVKHTFYKVNGVKHDCLDAYIIRVEGVDSQKRFLDEIHVPGRPPIQIKDTNRNSNRDTLPIECNHLIRELFSSIDHDRSGKSLYSAGLRMKLKYALSSGKCRQYLDYAKSVGLENEPAYLGLSAILDGDAYFDKVTAVEDAGEDEVFDIEVKDYHNYILNNICVHNSLNLSRSEIFDAVSIPQFQILYIAPLQEQTRRYSDLYISEAINSCEIAQTLQSNELSGVLSDAKIMKAAGHQAFANGAGIQLSYAKTSADRARGITADLIDFDELQDQIEENIPVISESLTSSKFGSRRFTGTAKTMGNTIQRFFEKSSQCEWVIKCEGCGTYNIPNIEGGVLKMIQGDGLHCVHCGKKLHVRSGQWVAAFPDKMSTFRGYHIPQVVVPAIEENPNNWRKLLAKLMSGNLTTFIQENLGISRSTGQRIITQEDIRRRSVLPNVKQIQEEFKNGIRRYAYTVMGIDWGGAEKESFTVDCVCGIRPDRRVDVLWAERFSGLDPDTQFAAIARAYNYYNCTMVAADYGMGVDRNIILSHRFGLPVVQVMYTRQNHLFGKNNATKNNARSPNWTVDKFTALNNLFYAIKYGHVNFPREGFEIYTEDLLSPYEEVHETSGLTTRFYQRTPGRPDDFAQALCFAVIVAARMRGEMIDAMIPGGAFNAETAVGTPVPTIVDPKEYQGD